MCSLRGVEAAHRLLIREGRRKISAIIYDRYCISFHGKQKCQRGNKNVNGETTETRKGKYLISNLAGKNFLADHPFPLAGHRFSGVVTGCDIISLVLEVCLAFSWFCYDEAQELETGELINEARLFLVLFPKNLTGSLTLGDICILYTRHKEK